MKFYEYNTLYDIHKKIAKITKQPIEPDHITYYHKTQTNIANDLKKGKTNTKDAITGINQTLAEINYITNNRPYYLIYPTITKYLTNLKAHKVPNHLIQLPEPTILFRLSEQDTTFDFQHNNKTHKLQTIFITYTKKEETLTIDQPQNNQNIMTLWIDVGEHDTINITPHTKINLPILTYKILKLHPHKTLAQTIQESNQGEIQGLQIPNQTIQKIIHLVASCCLIHQDKDNNLIQPDVLNQDKDRYQQTQDPKYIQKAKNRGKNGHTIGATLTTNPHWRNGTPLALYWTGPGRKTPTYRPRKGTIIHRQKIKTIPTGYNPQQ